MYERVRAWARNVNDYCLVMGSDIVIGCLASFIEGLIFVGGRV